MTDRAQYNKLKAANVQVTMRFFADDRKRLIRIADDLGIKYQPLIRLIVEEWLAENDRAKS